MISLNKVTLTKQSKLFYQKHRKSAKQDITNDFLPFLSVKTEIEKDVRLRNLLDIILPFSTELLVVDSLIPFHLDYYGKHKDDLQKQYNDDMKRLVLYREAVVYNCLEEQNFAYNVCLTGEGEKDNYALDFSLLNELADYPLKFKTDFDIKNENEIIMANIKQPFSLREVIKGVFSEYFDIPEKILEQTNEIKKRVREFEKGEVKTYTLEEVKEHLQEKAKKKESE